jgi:Ca2+-transporting ATPase
VNDTLALKGADIGVAMGIKGTDAAKEAADVVLADDNYVTISHGIFEGRKLFDNLTKGIKYYLSVKVALVLIFLLPALLNIPLPFSPVQIIVLELFMDLAASAGFVAEPAERTIYTRPPRDPKEKFLSSGMIKGIFVSGLSLSAAVVISYMYAVSQNVTQIQLQTIAFTTWMIAHILLAFVSRSEKEPLYSLGPLSNHLMDLWALGVAVFLVLGLTVPSIGLNLRLTSLTLAQIGIVIVISFVTTFWQELGKIFAT